MVGRKLFISIVILFMTFSSQIFSQSDNGFKWYVIDDFESCDNWPVINGDFFNPKYYNSNPRLAVIRGASQNLTDSPKKNCLGIKILSIEKVSNATELFAIPLKPIALPGICKKISFWVNGRDKKINIKIRFANYANYIYDLSPEPETLNFFGWQELVINDVDKKIAQIDPNRLDYKPLKIISIVIDNKYRQTFFKPFYIYIDQLKAYCNEYKLDEYDGSDIQDKW